MNTNTNTLSTTILTPRQSAYLQAYTDPASSSFGNAYQSAISAGYSRQFARNLTHLKPAWLSESIGNVMTTIQPEQLTQMLTGVMYSETEPTIIKLRAIELMMKYHGMLHRQSVSPTTVTLSLDLTGIAGVT